MFCRSLFVILSFFLLVIILPILLLVTTSDYPFGVFKHFLLAKLLKISMPRTYKSNRPLNNRTSALISSVLYMGLTSVGTDHPDTLWCPVGWTVGINQNKFQRMRTYCRVYWSIHLFPNYIFSLRIFWIHFEYLCFYFYFYVVLFCLFCFCLVHPTCFIYISDILPYQCIMGFICNLSHIYILIYRL